MFTLIFNMKDVHYPYGDRLTGVTGNLVVLSEIAEPRLVEQNVGHVRKGAWPFRRLAAVGKTIYRDEVAKNEIEISDPCSDLKLCLSKMNFDHVIGEIRKRGNIVRVREPISREVSLKTMVIGEHHKSEIVESKKSTLRSVEISIWDNCGGVIDLRPIQRAVSNGLLLEAVAG